MAVTIEAEATDDEWNLADWKEVMEERRPGSSTHSYQQTTATEVIQVPVHQVRSAITKLLGYSLSDNDPASDTAYRLLRPEVPCRHPWYRHLWADSVNVQEMAPCANEEQPGSASGLYKPQKDADPDATAWFYGPTYTGNNNTALLTVNFRSVPWKVWRDDDPDWIDNYEGEEWRRMVACVSSQPQLDLLTADGTSEFQMYYSEKDPAHPTPFSPIPGPGPGSDSFPGSLAIRKQQNVYELCWRGVEEQYLCGEYDPADIDEGVLMPSYRRLDRFLGCVNQSTFLGHKRHTLLFEGYRPVRYPFPGIRTNTSFGLMGLDLYLSFRKFDPPYPLNTEDSDSIAIPETSRNYGHLLFPWRRSKLRHWFSATSGTTGAFGTAGTSSGALALEKVDFYELFRHVDDPAYPLP